MQLFTGCAHTFGCNDNVKCCNSHFKCVRGPNQVNGTCAPWLPLTEEQGDCVVYKGCQKASDCCNKQFTCAHFEGQDDGICMPWLIAETKKDNCVADFEKGCVHVDGSDCCNDDFMCINGMCRNWVPILKRTTRRPTRRTTRRPTHRTTRRPTRRTTRRHRLVEKGEACKTRADCSGRAICESGHCRPLILEDVVGKSQDVGCPKCKTVADCPKYAHCGFNGCCQFW